MDIPRLSESESRKWTRPDDYIEGLMRRRTGGLGDRGRRQRTEPETPRLLLSTVPFIALLAGLGILGVAIMIAAAPWAQPQPRQPQPVQHERGVAAKGWFQEAQKDMR